MLGTVCRAPRARARLAGEGGHPASAAAAHLWWQADDGRQEGERVQHRGWLGLAPRACAARRPLDASHGAIGH
eukprot:3111737-Prymnesium_polylepis.1